MRRGHLWVGFVLWGLSGACTDHPAPTRADLLMPACEQVCASPACDPTVEYTDAEVQRCSGGCGASVVEAEADGEACATSYEAWVDCLAAANCEELVAWAQAPDEGSLCELPRAELETQCSGFDWRSVFDVAQ